ncbi:SRPBCC family protein [Polymorphospora sp. NPDC050346]|uniref:SRPBCC family protein n=1 Tax=Polymorphospora sp. NPDC050346 TaxID=3155780 RepID=UPI0033E09246
MTEPMTLRARVAAPLAAVHTALTDAGALRTWFAEHAEVELPHHYEFWGRHTPEGDAPHQRLLHVDDQSLRLAWVLDGEETTLAIDLTAESADSTLITLSQTHFDFSDVITGKSIRGVLNTFWALSIANLIDHLEGRPLTPRVDFTSAELRAEVEIDAPAEKIFESLTDSAAASSWFGYPIEIEPHVGGRYAMGGFDNNPNPAKIVDLTPGRRLTVDWGPAGVNTWELEGSAGRTRLTLVQSGFDTGRPPYAGWAGTLSGLAELRRYHELPDWQPVWLAA